VNLGDRYLSAQAMLDALRKLKDGVAKDTRPMGSAVMSPTATGGIPVSRPSASSNTQQRLCRYCYRPMARMASTCPSCGEKN